MRRRFIPGQVEFFTVDRRVWAARARRLLSWPGPNGVKWDGPWVSLGNLGPSRQWRVVIGGEWGARQLET